MERFSCTILYLACRRAFSWICRLPTRDADGEEGAESFEGRPEPSNKLLDGALREGVVALGDDLAAKLEDDDCRGGGCSRSEVTLSRSDRFEASEANADVGTVSKNLKTPVVVVVVYARLLSGGSAEAGHCDIPLDGGWPLGAPAPTSSVLVCLLRLTGLLLDCLPSSMTERWWMDRPVERVNLTRQTTGKRPATRMTAYIEHPESRGHPSSVFLSAEWSAEVQLELKSMSTLMGDFEPQLQWMKSSACEGLPGDMQHSSCSALKDVDEYSPCSSVKSKPSSTLIVIIHLVVVLEKQGESWKARLFALLRLHGEYCRRRSSSQRAVRKNEQQQGSVSGDAELCDRRRR